MVQAGATLSLYGRWVLILPLIMTPVAIIFVLVPVWSIGVITQNQVAMVTRDRLIGVVYSNRIMTTKYVWLTVGTHV